MIIRRKERLFSAAVFVPAALMVLAFAFVQYRSSNQESEATSLRLADSLEMSMINWDQELFHDFTHLCEISLLDPQKHAETNLQRYAQSLAEWRSIAHYPDLVSNLYVARSTARGGELLKYNPSSDRFEPDEWTPRFYALQHEFKQIIHQDSVTQGAGQRSLLSRSPISNAFFPERLKGWQIEPNIPALVYPIPSQTNHLSLREWIVVELNQDTLRRKVFADLARKHFQGSNGLDYQVAVVQGRPRRVIFSSGDNFGEQPIPDADGVLNIFGRPLEGVPDSAVRVFYMGPAETGRSVALDLPWFPVFSSQPPYQDWHLIVRHRRGGPLGAFIVEQRRHNITVSLSVLFLLLASLGMLLISTRRAQSLARLQMEFVATVSHELRTPLTAISAAADNLAGGLIDDKKRLAQYGTLIQSQTHRLSLLVDQVLLFTAMRQARQWYALQEVEVQSVLDASLASTSNLPQFSQFTLESKVDAYLPHITCDPALLSQCIQNLISNALKYDDGEKWVGLFARYNQTSNEVEISVADRGIGIASEDLPHIFEPFYRSESVRLAQVRGTGIGLAVAKNIVEIFNGRLEVNSFPGKGSIFTIYLQSAQRDVQTRESCQEIEVNA